MELEEFSIYENVGATRERFIKEMSAWAQDLEHAGRLPHRWCIMDDRIQVVGDVNLKGITIDYPFGTVGGYFECDNDQKTSPNYPTYVAKLTNI